MGITAAVVEEFFGGSERGFAVYVPGFSPQGFDQSIKAFCIRGFVGEEQGFFEEGLFEEL